MGRDGVGRAVQTAVWSSVFLAVLSCECSAWSAAEFPVPPTESLDGIDPLEVDQHIRVLSSDDFEGRGVGTEGELKSVAYIAQELKKAGFRGVVHERQELAGFFQHVPFQGVFTHRRSHLNATLADGRVERLWHGDGIALTTDLDKGAEISLQREEVLFGGYCINAPGHPHGWNDFEGVDVRDKVLVCLVYQPIRDERFGGPDAPLTYYGRWVYKFEEARRLGAKGVLLVHTEKSAGYGWSVIKAGAETESVRLEPSEEAGSPLQVRGWIHEEAALTLLDLDVDNLFAEAEGPGFVARPLAVQLDAEVRVRRRFFSGINVVAELPALDEGAEGSDEAVILTAHHDHLGVQSSPDANENFAADAIYNGALDNASGVSKLLALASAFSKLRRDGKCCRRKLVLITPTAEEAVLLGSSFYSSNPVAAPLHKTIAAVNFDGMNIWGKTRDIVGIGSQYSDLGKLLSWAAAAEGMVVSEDPEPRQGLFYRSDQLPFAKAGVPAMKLTHGSEFLDRDEQYFDRVVQDYNNNRYHQVNDDYDYINSHENPYAGALQEIRVAFRVLYGLLSSDLQPQWDTQHAFAQARRRMLDEEL